MTAVALAPGLVVSASRARVVSQLGARVEALERELESKADLEERLSELEDELARTEAERESLSEAVCRFVSSGFAMAEDGSILGPGQIDNALGDEDGDAATELLAEAERDLAQASADRERLEAELKDARADLARERSKAMNLELALEQRSATDDALFGARRALDAMAALPRTAAEALALAEAAWPDRLAFLPRARSSARGASADASELWPLLRILAVVVWPRALENGLSLRQISQELACAHGIEMAPTEGPMTKGNPNLMAMRKDVWDGRELDFSAHLKGRRSSAAEKPLRVHFAVDTPTRKVVVSWAGDHLDNSLTAKVS